MIELALARACLRLAQALVRARLRVRLQLAQNRDLRRQLNAAEAQLERRSG